jgi:hypothetical protein
MRHLTRGCRPALRRRAPAQRFDFPRLTTDESSQVLGELAVLKGCLLKGEAFLSTHVGFGTHLAAGSVVFSGVDGQSNRRADFTDSHDLHPLWLPFKPSSDQ